MSLKQILDKSQIKDFQSYYDPMNVRTWPYRPIEMPLTKDGDGPAKIGEDAEDMVFEVWDIFCNTLGSHKYLPDAINQAMQLTKELFE